MCNYGSLHLRINEILAEKGISKNKICKDLDIPRSNFNRFYPWIDCISKATESIKTVAYFYDTTLNLSFSMITAILPDCGGSHTPWSWRASST